MFKTRYFLAALLAIVVCACHPAENNDGKQNEGENNTEQNDSTQTPEPIITPEEPEPDPFWDVVEIDTEGLIKTTFTEDPTNIPNPERGFYDPYGFSRSSSTVSVSDLKAKRTQSRTIALYEFWLANYMETELDQAYLDCINNAFTAAREAGIKCIVRFGYKQSMSSKAKPWDPEVDIVMRHIEQVAPILADNIDVIMCMQAGFVGSWGEWYYTDHFVMGPTDYESYTARRNVVLALLDALPRNRQVGLRMPRYKYRMFAIERTDTITHATAYTNDKFARIGGHNDCFVANDSDQGTFGTQKDRDYWSAESKYTFMGGETCDDSNFYSDCNNTLKDLAYQHWSYLNIAYHGGVLRKWNEGGCRDEINLRLGYRLIMNESYISSNITAGSEVRTVFKLTNNGWAAPINPRGLELILVNKSSGEKTVITVPTEKVDPRFWLAGKKPQFEVKFTAPEAGSYTLYLNLPDPEPTLHDNPYYSIRLANENTWEEETGYNKITEFEVN